MKMSAQEYVNELETNAIVLAVLVIGLKDFAGQILRHLPKCDAYDDEAFSELRKVCIKNLKTVRALGAPLEQEAKAQSDALRLFQQIMDDVIARSRARPD
jgi:hypothetical protein